MAGLYGLLGTGAQNNIVITAKPAGTAAIGAGNTNANVSSATTGTDSEATKTFLDYMKKSAAQHLRDAWLKSHNLTEEKLAAMSPTERAAVEKQIAEDIKKQMQEEAAKKVAATGLTGLLNRAAF
jgi:hypothetical protein